MCGIFGYVAKEEENKSAVERCLHGLKLLEYRGYDSAGLAGIKAGNMLFYKRVGKVKNLVDLLSKQEVELGCAIAHTRWATHGKLTELNAHPHFDETSSIALVHNGIIENFQELKSHLEKHGMNFQSETDSEVITQLISFHNKKGSLIDALVLTLEELHGSFAFACLHKDTPNTIYAAARDCPLIVAKCTETNDIFISSDANALSGRKMELFFLHDGEIAAVSPNTINIYDKRGNLIEKLSESLGLTFQNISKDGYEHFMLKEIFEQPKTLSQATENRFSVDTSEVLFPECAPFAKEFEEIDHIRLIACGTSYHAGLLAATIFENITGIETSAEIASEFRYRAPILRKNTLVIALSQSGETADTLAALALAKEMKALTLGIGNVAHSSLSRSASMFLELCAGPEISVCSTKAFTSQIAVLLLVGLYIKQKKRGVNKQEDLAFFREFSLLSGSVTDVLQQKDAIKAMAEKYARFQNFFFLGRHLMYPTCLEAALKLKEISYVNATGYPAGELKHGPIALIDAELPSIAFLGNEATLPKMISNLMEIKSRGGPVLAFAPKHCQKITTITDDVVWLFDGLSDPFTPIPYSVAAQLFAYYIAKTLGKEIDQPRNLAKSVTVE